MRAWGFRMPDLDVAHTNGQSTIERSVLHDMQTRLDIGDKFHADVVELLSLPGGASDPDILASLEWAVSLPIGTYSDDVSSLTDLLSRAEEEIDNLRTRLDNALHAAYRLASVACDISGADMQAVQRAADKCGCDHEDSPEPHNPRREWREG